MSGIVLSRSIATTQGAILLPLGVGVTISGVAGGSPPGAILGLGLVALGGLYLYAGLKK